MGTELHERLRKLFVSGVVALTAACASDDGSCGAGCREPEFGFSLARPAAGEQFTITVEPHLGTLTCDRSQAAGGGCASSTMVAGFDQTGALSGATFMRAPEPGSIRIVVEVDGAIFAEQAFEYHPHSREVCGVTCSEGVFFRVE